MKKEIAMKITASEPAFPSEEGMFGGLTIREYFSAKAMTAMIGSHDYSRNGPHETVVDHETRLAHHAVRFADALIKELEK